MQRLVGRLSVAAGLLLHPAFADEAAKSAQPAAGVATPAALSDAAKSTDKSPPPTRPAATDAVVLDSGSLESIISRSVKSVGGEDMGRIVDMLVLPSGQVRAVVIDFGGFLGVGSRKIAVDWKALKFNDLEKSGNVIVALTRNQVRMAPEYKAGDPIVLLEASPPDGQVKMTVPAASTKGGSGEATPQGANLPAAAPADVKKP